MAITNINEYVPVIVNQEFDWFPKEVVTADELNEIFDSFKTQGNYTAEALTTVIEKINFNYSELRRDVDALTAGTVPDGAITTEKLAGGAVTTEKITDKAITKAKLADVINSEFQEIHTKHAAMVDTHRTDVNILYSYIRYLFNIPVSEDYIHVFENGKSFTKETIVLTPGNYTCLVVSAGATGPSRTIYSNWASTIRDGGGSGAACLGSFDVNIDDIFYLEKDNNVTRLYSKDTVICELNDANGGLKGTYDRNKTSTTYFNLATVDGEDGQASPNIEVGSSLYAYADGESGSWGWGGYNEVTYHQLYAPETIEVLNEKIPTLLQGYVPGTGGSIQLPNNLFVGPYTIIDTPLSDTQRTFFKIDETQADPSRYVYYTASKIAPVPKGLGAIGDRAQINIQYKRRSIPYCVNKTANEGQSTVLLIFKGIKPGSSPTSPDRYELESYGDFETKNPLLQNNAAAWEWGNIGAGTPGGLLINNETQGDPAVYGSWYASFAPNFSLGACFDLEYSKTQQGIVLFIKNS